MVWAPFGVKSLYFHSSMEAIVSNTIPMPLLKSDFSQIFSFFDFVGNSLGVFKVQEDLQLLKLTVYQIYLQ